MFGSAGAHPGPGIKARLGQRLESAGAAADIVRRGTVFQALTHPVETGLKLGDGALDILALALEHLDAANKTVDGRLEALAAAAVGADGLIVEVHPRPDEAVCDGPQQLRTSDFAAFAEKVEKAAALTGRTLGGLAAV